MQNNFENGYILHQRPFSESTLILDLFTKNSGRLSVIAKGARRAKSNWRGLLVSFRPLLLAWVGKSDLKTLRHAEADGRDVVLKGTRLWCGLYLNELLMRLLNIYDPHSDIYMAYINALQKLDDIECENKILRCFERDLLKGLGYGIEYIEADTYASIEPDVMYSYDPLEGFKLLGEKKAPLMISGASILALKTGEFEDMRQLRESKMILLTALQVQLGAKPLQTKILFKELQKFF